MFTEMRREDRELSPEETKEILLKGLYGVLSMNGADSYGYGVPLSYVYTGNSLYFHCAWEGKKLAHLRRDNKVSFCVVAEAIPMTEKFSMRYKSVMAFGKIHEVDGQEKLPALLALVDKYACDDAYRERGQDHAVNALAKTAVLRMDIDRLTGKARR
jgi:nitroimidazol reductase NimA-like FMN-containing flavoprotein (pyridoxamine 5'-phosphate oxidase superfamily)